MKLLYTKYTFSCLIISVILCLLLNMPGQPDIADLGRIRTEDIHPVDLQSNGNFYGFDFLREEVDEKNIVLIGETEHYDGSSLAVKTGLVKFLHKEAGFNTLLFEGGSYDMYLLQKQLETNPSDAHPEDALWPFWSETVQTRELWNYIRDTWSCCSSGNAPLYVGGVDCQYSGNKTDSMRFVELETYYKRIGINLGKKFPTFSRLMPRLDKILMSHTGLHRILDDETIVSADNEMQEMCRLAISDDKDLDLHIWQYIDGLRNRLLYTWKYEVGNNFRTIWRDSLMTENFIRYKLCHPEEKIILWTSNVHASKSGALNYHAPDFPVINLGSRLSGHYGDSLYVILLSSWARETDRKGHRCSFKKTSSLEYAIHCNIVPKYKERYLLFSDPSQFGSIMTSGIMEGEYICDPDEMCDALLYEDTIEFVRYNEDEK